MSDDKNKLAEALKQLEELAEGDSTLLDLSTQEPEIDVKEVDLTKVNPTTNVKPVQEGGRVTIQGKSMIGEGEDIELSGTVHGVSPIIYPGVGIAGYEYIVKLDDTSLLPTDDGTPYPYTCITIAVEACMPEEEKEDG